MYLPHIKHTENATRQMLSVFGGYNHNTVISEGEFYEMTNMTSNLYPVLSSRPSRKGYANHAECVMWVGDKRISLQPPHVVIGKETDTVIDLGLQSGVEHRAVVSGAYLVIFPEAVFVNLMRLTERGALSQKTVISTLGRQCEVKLVAFPCTSKGRERTILGELGADGYPDSDLSPEELDGTLWHDPTDGLIYVYNAELDRMVEESDSYIGIHITAYPFMFNTDEASSWMSHLKFNDYIEFANMPGKLSVLNGKHTVVYADVEDKGVLVIKGYMDKGAESVILNEGFDLLTTNEHWVECFDPMPSVSFVIPPLDFITSCETILNKWP